MNKSKALISKVLKAVNLYNSVRRAKIAIAKYSPKNIRYQKKILRFYSQLVQPGDLCFDIGANVGDITHVLLKLGATVVAVEPQEVCLRSLYKRYRKNKRVTIVGKAVGEKEGYGELAVCESANTISTLSDKWRNAGRFSRDYKWTKTQTVPITTLDSLISLYGQPTFCKIDVEGFEPFVLKGLSKPIHFISFEFTREFFDDAKECINYLLSIGEIKVNCSLGASWEFLFPWWVEPDELYNKLESTKDELLQGDIYIKFV